MIQDSFCCPNCFENKYIQEYIKNNSTETGKCLYCDSNSNHLISVRKLGIYMRECIEKAYDGYDNGTGAIYESEEKIYWGPDGEEATFYSIREIMNEEEMAISDKTLNTSLLEDLFENLYSYREIQKGAEDPYADIDSPNWVIKDDLYGCEQTQIYHKWEYFKHIIKHYNRFFDMDRVTVRKKYLEAMNPYIKRFKIYIPKGTRFYRIRRINESLSNINEIEPYRQMGPPKAILAKTNRMSPAGIPYLYLASDEETAIKECRINIGEEVIIAEFELKERLKILDLSVKKSFSPDSIFDPTYDHDNRWMNSFWSSFVEEVSAPVSEENDKHPYEYAATQLVAEYYKSKGYEGICYKSSVGNGKSYVFFVGPDPKYTPDAYPFPFKSDYYFNNLPIQKPFTDCFQIKKLVKLKWKEI